MNRLVSYLTGAVALLIVATSIVAALVYAVSNGLTTLTTLATSTLSGVGMAVGSCIGAALVMKFKVARRFVKNTIDDVTTKHAPVTWLGPAIDKPKVGANEI
jgi:uncharacterized membrane protein YciS (DUF1049 family)